MRTYLKAVFSSLLFFSTLFFALPQPASGQQDGDVVHLFFTGDLYGYLKPCG